MTKTVFFRRFGLGLLVLLAFVFQASTSFLPEIFGGKPLLLPALAFAIASFEDKVPSLIFGAVCGTLTDLASSSSVGYFAILLTLLCYFESHIFSNIFVPNFFSAFVFSTASTVVLIGGYFLFFKLFASVDGWQVLFVNHYISRIIYSAAVFVPIYFVVKFVGMYGRG